MSDKAPYAVCFSHIGKRLNHEDNFLVNGNYLTSAIQSQMSDNRCYCFTAKIESNVHLYAVSDGMGGHNAGEIASRICVERLSSAYQQLQHYSSLKDIVAHLQKEIAEINSTVCEMSRSQDDLKGMGATLVLLVVYGEECAVLNIGDSRAYRFVGEKIVQITKDNTEGQRMLDLGLLTRKELSGFPARKNLNRYIGYNQRGYVLQADEYYFSMDSETVLLCSDGISDFLSNERILEILSLEENLDVAGKQLIDEAVVSQNADNATVVLIPLRR